VEDCCECDKPSGSIKCREFRTSFCIELSTVLTFDLKLHERQIETVPQVNYTYTGP
jgi:hypothetical protein